MQGTIKELYKLLKKISFLIIFFSEGCQGWTFSPAAAAEHGNFFFPNKMYIKLSSAI